MNKESFRILKEINSLHTLSDKTQKLIETEKQRIAKIEKQHTLKKEELETTNLLMSDLRKKLTQCENEMNKLQSLIEQSQAHLNQVFTAEEMQALESQINQAKQQLGPLEEQTLELMQEIEEKESHQNEIKKFLTGVLETIQEIQKDVDQAIAPHTNELKSLQSRVDLLISELPENVINKLNQLREKNLTLGPLSEIAGKKCSVCNFQLDQSLISEVEKNLKFKTCSGCGRILIPINARY